MISTCYRLKHLTFESVGMNIPIEPNRKRGRPKATAPALQRQNDNIQEPRDIDDGEDDENTSNQLLRRTQRQRKRSNRLLESTRIQQPNEAQPDEQIPQNKRCPKCENKTILVLSH